jgi:hypothetical protein
MAGRRPRSVTYWLLLMAVVGALTVVLLPNLISLDRADRAGSTAGFAVGLVSLLLSASSLYVSRPSKRSSDARKPTSKGDNSSEEERLP